LSKLDRRPGTWSEGGLVTTTIAILSIVMLLAAAAAAFSLVRITHRRWVWVAIGLAVTLFAVLRAITISDAGQSLVAEIVYLTFSTLLFAGLLGARPLCRELHKSVESLSAVQHDLQSALTRLGYVLESAPVVVFALDKNGVFTLSEGRGLESLGLRPGQVVGRSAFDVYKDHPEIVANIRRALLGEELTAPVDVVDMSYEAHYSPLLDDKGRVEGVFGVAVDVSRRRHSESQLRASKDRFRALVETTSDWVWEVDSDAVYTYAGSKVKDLLGYEPDELIGKTPFDLMPEAERARVREQFHSYASQGRPFAGLVNSNQHKDGQRVVLETSGVPVFDDEGQLIGYRGIDRDITARTVAVEALRASEERLNLAILAANMGTWDWDIKTDEVTWSEQVEHLFGLKKGEFDGTYAAYVSLIHPDDRDHVQFAINSALEGRVSPFRVLHRITTPGGDTRWIEAIGQVIRDEDGRPERMLGVITDVTDREISDRQLRREKETAQTYLDIVGTIVVAIGKDRTVQLINQKGCEILGYDEKDILGKDWFDCFLPEDIRAEVGTAFEQLTAGELEAVEYYENPVITATGEERLIAWHNATIEDDDGDIMGTLSSGSDVTDRRRAERMKQELENQLRHSQRMETIGTLAGGIAHDFNNILSPILGYADMALEDAGEDSPIHDYLEQVVKATHRAKELVEQILLFSKNVEREASPIHLHLIMREGLKFVRASLPTTIEIQQNVNIESGVVMANSAQIHQVLVNLCTNAAHAMRETGGVLRVTLEPVELDAAQAEEITNIRPGKYAKMTVSDTGRGMDSQTLERIFEPFFTTKDTGEGTGLGLSVVHGIVVSHGGAIDVESESGKGTTVAVYLPRSEKAAVKEGGDDGGVASGDEHVLFVDDDPEIAVLGKRMLERLGYQVTTATTGEEALKAIRANPDQFDVVITDQTMPHKTGLVLTEEVREIKRSLPVILMTGYSDKITQEKLEALAIRGLVMKPLAGKKLGSAIRQALDNHFATGEQ